MSHPIFRIIFILNLCITVAVQAGPLEVFPSEINLKFKQDRQSLAVRWEEPNGVQRNVTAEAIITAEDPARLKIENGVVWPLVDGATKVKVEFQGQTVEVPVKVENAGDLEAVSFLNDVMPIFLRHGCNSGGCHGASRGKDGFRLSLFGYDPNGDYFSLTREMAGRRINLALPEESLLITKSIGAAPHTGGKLFEKDSEDYQILKRWLEAGAANDDETKLPACTKIEILPKPLLLESPDQQFQMTVRAYYSDGTDRDVTKMSLFLSNNEGTAKIDKEGIITTGQRGEAFVMARFHTYTVGTQVVVIPKGLQYTKPQVEEWNYVDTLVNTKLDKLRMQPSGVCNDDIFLRRAHIDITGTLPTSDEVMAFTANADTGKRAAKIDELLQREEFVDIWALKWSELLQMRSDDINSYKAVKRYYEWVRGQISSGVPVNEMAKQLIGSSGTNFENPAVNYYQIENDPLKLAEDTAQVFFGTRIQCAQCHNHPFDRWDMADYRGFVAFFTQIGRKETTDPREKVIFNSGGGDSKHPVTNAVVPPKFLGGTAPDTAGKDRRQILADWIATPDNPFFARHMANLIWAQHMGRGIVEPVDDVRISNPPSNPELLDGLAAKLVEYNFDFRKLVRDICNSATYQRATKANESNSLDNSNFSKATIRRIRAEVMLDCISQVTETKDKFRGLPPDASATEVADGKNTSYFLTTFGRSEHKLVCSREEVGPTLSQALHLINGDTVEGKIAGGVLDKLVKAKPTPKEAIEEMYLRCLGRKPNDTEMQKLEEQVKAEPEPNKAYADILWALLNSKEFMFNH